MDVKRVYMECTTAGHNKFYEVWIADSTGGFDVMFRYGKIGTPGVGGRKNTHVLSLSLAERLMNDLKYEKQNKGYVVKQKGGKTDETVEKIVKAVPEEPKKAKKGDDDKPRRNLIV